jgi:hypothetical protein
MKHPPDQNTDQSSDVLLLAALNRLETRLKVKRSSMSAPNPAQTDSDSDRDDNENEDATETASGVHGVIDMTDWVDDSWLQTVSIEELLESFEAWIKKRSVTDKTFAKWAQYLKAVANYLMLYHGTHIRHWYLRLAAVKRLGQYFRSFDRTWYQRLVPQHLAILARTPPYIIDCFINGGFALKLDNTGLAIDDAHESKINRMLKGYIRHPTAALIAEAAVMLPAKVRALNEFTDQFMASMG